MPAFFKRFFRHSALLAGSVFLAIVPAWARQAEAAQPHLRNLVVIGDSLSAGFQNFSLYDSDSIVPAAPPGGQSHGFANLIAEQANVSLALPLIQYPGIPPVLTFEGGVISRASGIGTREPQTLTVQTHNLSVPGFELLDVLVHKVNLPNLQSNPQAASFADALAVEILGYPSLLTNPPFGCGVIPRANGDVLLSEALCAIELKPTTILISAGNEDALQALTVGAQPTDLKLFAAYYQLLLEGLSRYTKAKIVVSNIPNVTDIPFLVSYLGFEARCGMPPAGAGPTDYLVPNITDPNVTTFNICTNYSVRSASLIAQAQTAVHDYNLIIAAAASKFGAVVVDVNKLFAGIAANGYDVAGHHLTNLYLGGIFSLDAVHPTNTGYALLANAFIDKMNCELHTNIPPVNIEQVAATDPLICLPGSLDPTCPVP
ncbi:MAG: SGNH/GDSL hydrolase family protein [Bryobacteraceae bacterium]